VALTHWTFLYVADGLPDAGEVRQVVSDASTSVLAGFPHVEAALESCRTGAVAGVFAETQLIELCGAFGHHDVAELRRMRPDLPVGLVGYSGEMTDQLHALVS
jgi:hypothetical protein